MNNKEYAHNLRLLANLYERHDSLPTPQGVFQVYCDGGKSRAVEIVRDLGNVEKKFSDYYFTLIKTVGSNAIHFSFAREAVCERKVVGTRTVPELHVDEHLEDIVEWECHPLLKI